MESTSQGSDWPESDNSTRISTVPFFDYNSQPEIEITNGCVLIPIVFAVWWYYTRRAARRAFRLLITGGEACFDQRESSGDSVSSSRSVESGSHNGAEEQSPVQNRDKFHSWDDVIQNNQQQSSSLHLVRWITSKRSKKRKVRAISKAVMNRAASGKTNVYNANQNLQDDDESNCDGLLSFDDALSAQSCAWECIEDVDSGAIETVSIPRALADDVSFNSGGSPMT